MITEGLVSSVLLHTRHLSVTKSESGLIYQRLNIAPACLRKTIFVMFGRNDV